MRQLVGIVAIATGAAVIVSILGLILIAATHDGDITPTVVTALVAIATSAVAGLMTSVTHYIMAQSMAGGAPTDGTTTDSGGSVATPVASPVPVGTFAGPA